MPNTNVSGDISAFSRISNLERLNFGSAKISGNIDSIRSLNKIQSLLLHKTAILEISHQYQE